MALTRDQIITLVMSRLDRDDLRSELETEILLLQEQTLEGAPFKPWFLEQTDSNLVSMADTETIALPSGFLRLQEEMPLARYDSSITAPDKWVLVKKDFYQAISDYYFGRDTGAPEKFALQAASLALRPIPDAVYTFRLRYYKRDVALSSDIANNWTANAADVVIAELCKIGAQIYLKDELMVEKFDAQSRMAWDRLRRERVARQMAGMDMEMGD